MDLKETETEENYVRRLATGLCTVWNNNPKVFKWWSGVSISLSWLHRRPTRLLFLSPSINKESGSTA